MHDALVSTIFLNGIENTIDNEYDERALTEVPVVGTEVNLIVFACHLEDGGRTAIGKPEQDAHGEHTAKDEQESLHHIHPDNGLHSAEISEQNDDDADEYDDIGNVNACEGSHGHSHQIENGSHLGKVLQDEGQRTVVAGQGSETAFEILIGGKPDDAAEQRHDEPNHSEEHDGHHQSLNEQYPVAGVGRTRISQEGDARNNGCKH